MNELAPVVAALVVVAATLTTVGCAPSELVEEETRHTESALYAGRQLSETEVATHLRNAGFPESIVPTMVCTAWYESEFFEAATHSNTDGSIDRGLMQVNSIHVGARAGCPSSGEALFDAATNVRCAYAIYQAQGLRAWVAYTAHQAECNAYRLGSRSGGSGGGGGGGAATPPATSSGDACWSQTLDRSMRAGTCVESAFDGIWYQCNNGIWYSGVNGRQGPFGRCVSLSPL